ncbi:MAG TPA: hypothetical protein VMV78_10550 [Thiobacillus sp.]|nr:hypothetical protein [Thiobacillus sp.]
MKCERCHCDLPKGNIGLVWHLAHGNQASVCEDCYSALKQLELDSVSRGFQDVAEEGDNVKWAEEWLETIKTNPTPMPNVGFIWALLQEFIRRFRAKDAELATAKSEIEWRKKRLGDHDAALTRTCEENDRLKAELATANAEIERRKADMLQANTYGADLANKLAKAKADIERLNEARSIPVCFTGALLDKQEKCKTCLVHDSCNSIRYYGTTVAPAPDEECEELAQICIASAQYQEATCTSTPGTFSSKACRRIAAILRSMNPAKRHKIEWWFPEGDAMFGARGCGREYHSENLQAALGYILWLSAKDLGIDITERKEPTK